MIDGGEMTRGTLQRSAGWMSYRYGGCLLFGLYVVGDDDNDDCWFIWL